MDEMPGRTESARSKPGIRGPRDFYGGLGLMAIALLALWASKALPGMSGFSIGEGTVPRILAVLLLAMGAGIALTGLMVKGEPLQRYGLRGLFFITLAVLVFSAAIRPLGLVISTFSSFIIAALGTPETKWIEALVVGALLTLGCSLLFPHVLGLPFDLFPTFMR